MEKNNVKRDIWIMVGVFVLCAVVIVAGGIHMYGLEQTEEAVEHIHATKLNLSDVVGSNLPPDPGPEKDATVEGIDANKNGIRDDVELAIFKQYPDSAKIRAVLLQYATVLQMEAMYPLNKVVATAIGEKDSKAYDCIGNVVSDANNDIEEIKMYRAFVKDRQLTTIERKNRQKSFDEEVDTFELQSGCDIDVTSLPNL